MSMSCAKIDNFIKMGTCLFGPNRIMQIAGSFKDDGPKPTSSLTTSVCIGQTDRDFIKNIIHTGFANPKFLRNQISRASADAMKWPANASIYISSEYLRVFYTAYALKCIYYTGPDVSIRDVKIVNAPKTESFDYADYIDKCLDYIDDIHVAHPNDALNDADLDVAIDELFNCSPRYFK